MRTTAAAVGILLMGKAIAAQQPAAAPPTCPPSGYMPQAYYALFGQNSGDGNSPIHSCGADLNHEGRGAHKGYVVFVILVVFVVVANLAPVAAQSTDRQHDIGATMTWLNLNGLDQIAGGLGGRIGTHLADLLWLDAEANVFPTDDPITGRKLQAFAGAKLGSRSRLFGLFGKVRPGGIRFGRDFIRPETACVKIFPPPQSCLASRRAFALDYGSVIEVYPSDRSILRFDVATTHLWYGSQGGGERVHTGNFQFSLGFARRF